MCHTLSALSLILTASLPGAFYSYFTDEEVGAQRDKIAGHGRSGGLRIQTQGLFLLYHQARGKLGANPVPGRARQAMWPVVANSNSGRAGSSVGMRATVDYETRNSVPGTR